MELTFYGKNYFGCLFNFIFWAIHLALRAGACKQLKHLQQYGREIPAGFEQAIDKDTLNKMVDYTIDNSRLNAEDVTDDIITFPAFIFAPAYHCRHALPAGYALD